MNNESVQSILQGRTIKGQIIDENNEPLIGVSVTVKGANTIGTITDFDGNYTLDVPAGKNSLEISYIGYKTQEITIGKNTQLNIKMQPDTQILDEVVVVGYGTVKKRDLTGAVASVKSEDIVRMPTSNVLEAIQGQVAGLDITRSSGEAWFRSEHDPTWHTLHQW
ncbi:carboxypeptidase-like regulatory domain-containing protein [Phocaeicola dorei]|nr:carboxypeptidase-like regulatory domain-containing protein [Phocaeicola dorei]MCS3155441.1 carboxypeptidase-like regulatory domain-containing protein [Phocaeicola dorei]